MGDAHDHTSRGRAAQPGRARELRWATSCGNIGSPRRCPPSSTANGPPTRLMLLGEQLIAFRDRAGRVGVLDHRCPHRCASLFFGRNDKEGLRCAYHGWMFDVDGNCLDMPNVPKHQAFPNKITAKAYPVAERNGLIWTYMGARKEPPPLPMFEVGHDRRRQRAQSVHGAARMQLSAGARRRHRYLPSRLPAHGRGRRRGY